MEKYEKLVKALEMCAGPECCVACPYHGETRGGKTCRAWLLTDALTALVNEETRADAAESKANEVREVSLISAKVTEKVAKLYGDSEYWRGQADALKWFVAFYWGSDAVEELDDAEQPEAEADGHV